MLRVHDAIDDSRLQIKQHRPWNIVLIVGLIEKHIFSVDTLSHKGFQNSRRTNTMFGAKPLPELKPN